MFPALACGSLTACGTLKVRLMCVLCLHVCVQGTVAFFHPFADGGGGGERVLWWALPAAATPTAPSALLCYDVPTSDPHTSLLPYDFCVLLAGLRYRRCRTCGPTSRCAATASTAAAAVAAAAPA